MERQKVGMMFSLSIFFLRNHLVVVFEEEFFLDPISLVEELENIIWKEGESSMEFNHKFIVSLLKILGNCRPNILACIDMFLRSYDVSLGSRSIQEEFKLTNM